MATVNLIYPQIRDEVRCGLELLADEGRQRRYWREPDPRHRYWDLDSVVRALFDTVVLPDPVLQVGLCLYPDEVVHLLALSQVFDPLLEELSDAPDARYLDHPTWPEVVLRARNAAVVLRGNDERAEEGYAAIELAAADRPADDLPVDGPQARRGGTVGADPYADDHG